MSLFSLLCKILCNYFNSSKVLCNDNSILEETMNKSVYKYKLLFASLFIFVFSLLSFQTHAGDIKIIIGGYDDGKHFYKGHKKHYRYYNRPAKHRYYNKSRHNYKHHLGYKDHYYPKRYYKKKYYGNYYKPRSYYNDRKRYRNYNRSYYRGNRNYCPY